MYFFASALLFLATAQSQPTTYSAPEAPVPETEAPAAPAEAPKAEPQSQEIKAIEHFTGKVSKDRVRLRLEPTLDGAILKELSKNTLLVATGATPEFYAVLPQPGTKGYIFRTYVLDGEIVGNHVNVRLEPDTNAKIVCQLNSGDHVAGVPASSNNRWLEIDLPEQVRFYVAKDYVTKAGPESLYRVLEEKMQSYQDKLTLLDKSIQEEFKKPFVSIKLAPFAKELNAIAAQNSDFPEQAAKAQALLKKMQEDYLEKSLNSRTPIAEANSQGDLQNDSEEDSPVPATKKKASAKTVATAAPKQAIAQTEEPTEPASTTPATQPADAENQAKAADKGFETLRGIVRPYSSLAKNTPGDFILVDPNTNLPQAFLASSQVNLGSYIGKDVSLTVIAKDNNNFAYPAYTVLKAD